MRLLIAVLSLAVASSAAAQSLTILSSNATKALVEELGPQFEKATGQKLTLKFDNSMALKGRIENGEAFDVAVMTAVPTATALIVIGEEVAAAVETVATAALLDVHVTVPATPASRLTVAVAVMVEPAVAAATLGVTETL